MKLSAEDRLQLADALYASVPDSDTPEPAHEQDWADELARRIEEIRAGKVEGIPGDQVLAELRADLADRRG